MDSFKKKKKTIENIILNGKRLNAFSVQTKTRPDYPLFPLLLSTVLDGGPTTEIKQEKEIRGMKT